MPEEWRTFRKPAVVDQRVGFFLDGGSSVCTRDSPLLSGPLMVSRAGSLLRRTWRGISERQERKQGRYCKMLRLLDTDSCRKEILSFTLGGNNITANLFA